MTWRPLTLALLLLGASTAAALQLVHSEEHLALSGVKGTFHSVDWTDAACYALRVLVLGSVYGVVFGMMGAGGSLILKPLMYFGFGVRPFKHAIFNAFLVLFFLAGYAAFRGHKKGALNWRHAGYLGTCASGMGGALGGFVASRISSRAQLLCFAVLIIGAASYMLTPKKKDEKPAAAPSSEGAAEKAPEAAAAEPASEAAAEAASTEKAAPSAGSSEASPPEGGSHAFSPLTAVIAVVIGFFCGLTGVGGGFMLVPLLTYLGHGMATAVPTSQAVICATSGFGFVYYAIFNHFSVAELHPDLCLALLASSAAGLACSDRLSNLMSERARKTAFACVLILIGVFTLLQDPYCSSFFMADPLARPH